ncbi:MAG: amidohydrolase family protein [Clostridiaceae bacterium]|nr:amidohydrolase family protein [Clostridiaceae bacterium]
MSDKNKDRLADFVPERIFDMHAHIDAEGYWRRGSADQKQRAALPEVVGMEAYKQHQLPLYGLSEQALSRVNLRCNMILTPDTNMKTDLQHRWRAHEFLCGELEKYPQNIGSALVFPGDSYEDIIARLIHPRILGLKCYHVYADQQPTFQCAPEQYLPEAAWMVAHDRRMFITLHMVRDRALVDPLNLTYIRQMAQRYPDAVLILAHAGRSFATWTIMEAAQNVRDLPNVWFDISAICESPGLFELMRTIDTQRILWGSDFPVSHMRGKCVSLAEGFFWIYHDEAPEQERAKLYPIGREALLAFKQACEMLRLPRAQVEAIFYDNAAAAVESRMNRS